MHSHHQPLPRRPKRVLIIGVGTHLTNADTELGRTGERAPGTIVDFDDVRKASNRDIRVEFQSVLGFESDGDFLTGAGGDQHG